MLMPMEEGLSLVIREVAVFASYGVTLL